MDTIESSRSKNVATTPKEMFIESEIYDNDLHTETKNSKIELNKQLLTSPKVKFEHLNSEKISKKISKNNIHKEIL